MEKASHFIHSTLFHIGDTPITISGILGAIAIVLYALLISVILQRFMVARLKKHPKISAGMLFAFQRILHYSIIVIGVIVAAQAVGLNLNSLAVMFGFLSVGIGFGLRNIASNFISGLILLFERPVSVGDLIDWNGKVAEVISIKMRSTLVRTFDHVTIIVPNSKLIENDVINWSLHDPKVRVHCPVSVAYGSDVEKVKKVLLDIALNHKDVMDNPNPEVRFEEFGDSSLNFVLLVWTFRPDHQKVLRSDINFLIDEKFRENDIHIPFPQRDLHIKNLTAKEQFDMMS